MGVFQNFLGDCIAHCTKRHLHVAVWYLSIVLIIYAPPSKAQATFQYIAGYDFATNNAWSTFYNSDTQQCYSPTCTVMPASGAQVSSSSYAVGQKINMWNLADGEVISWRFTTPTGGVKTIGTLTYNKSTDCFIDSEHYQYCGSGDRIGFTYIGVVNSCSQPWSLVEVGPWSISTYDGSTLLYTNSFQVSHDSSGFLGVTFPADNQLIQLDKGNYNATDTLTFQAGTNTGAPIDWEIKLHYQSSGGYPNPPTDALLTFEGTTHSYSGFQAMGGQMTVTAQTIAADNSTVEDCVTAYVEGPETGIPNATITARLDQLYPASTSYNQYLNDGTATPNLLTGVAMHESSYQQFQTPAESNPNSDLFNLYANFKIAAKWPKENFRHNMLLEVRTLV